MRFLLCRHIKTNGTQCQSPAITGELHCYYHRLLHHRHSGFRHTDTTRGYLIPGHHIELTPLEDRDSVQVALSLVINALANGQLETKRATALLYGLQLASMNAARLDPEPFAPDIVRIVHSTPAGLDLAEPGATTELTLEFLDDEEEAEDEREEIDQAKEDTASQPDALANPAIDVHSQTENGDQEQANA